MKKEVGVKTIRKKESKPERIKTVTLSKEEAKSHVDAIGPSLGYDFTYDPEYPKTRKDVAAVRRLAENGSTYGYDTIYLVWKTKTGEIESKELMDSSTSKDYLCIRGVREERDKIVVKVSTGGSYGGKAWEKDIEVSKKEIGMK